jgi:hypothetical protein
MHNCLCANTHNHAQHGACSNFSYEVGTVSYCSSFSIYHPRIFNGSSPSSLRLRIGFSIGTWVGLHQMSVYVSWFHTQPHSSSESESEPRNEYGTAAKVTVLSSPLGGLGWFVSCWLLLCSIFLMSRLSSGDAFVLRAVVGWQQLAGGIFCARHLSLLQKIHYSTVIYFIDPNILHITK